MKLDEKQGFMEHGGVLETKEFGIGNKAVLFEILRSKMYPNPIKAFTQEIMSNARDANREVGKNDVPIEVQLPTRFDPCFYVRDFGPGISPERMENVFIMYGNSTKRDSNDQTGGFGLGAKSPWAYTDSFCIDTYIPDNNGDMIHRNYVAVIGKNKIGELKLLFEQKIENELQGTKITVACKPGDEGSFRDWVKSATQYWNHEEVKDSVRPVIKAADFGWEEKDSLFTGDRWFCHGKDQYYSRADPIAIIDGIKYKLNRANLKIDDFDATAKAIYDRLFYHPVFMFFNTGELPLAANREEIDYTPEAIKTIQVCLGELVEDLSKKIADSIKDAKDLYEANISFNKMRNNFSDIFKTCEWQGHKVTGNGPNIKDTGIHFINYSRNYKNDGSFRKSQNYYHQTFQVQENGLVLFNDEDCKNPNRRRLKTVFEENENLSSVMILQYPEDSQKKQDTKQKLKDADIDLWGIGNLSDYDKAPIVRNYNGGNSGNTKSNGYNVPKIWKYTGSVYNKKEAWNAVEDQKDVIEEGEGVYVILFRRQPSLVKSKKTIGLYVFQDLKNALGQDIYGVSEKAIKKLGKDWIPLEDAMLAKIKEIEQDPDIDEFVNAINTNCLCQDKFASFWNLMSKKYKDISDGKLKDYLDWSKKYNEQKVKVDNLNLLIRYYKNFVDSGYKVTKKKKNGKDFSKVYAEVVSTYPMLGEGVMDFYYGRWNKDKPELQRDLLDYIKMCDMRINDVGWEDDDEKEEKVA